MFKLSVTPTPRTSDAVEAINVNPVNGTCVLRFTNGYEYKYSNVNRFKLINLLMNDNMSLGFWVQSLSRDAIRQLDYVKGNTVATGRLCYQQLGIGWRTDALPC